MKYFITILWISMQLSIVFGQEEMQATAIFSSANRRLAKIKSAYNEFREALEVHYMCHGVAGFDDPTDVNYSLENLIVELTGYLEEGNQFDVPLNASLSAVFGRPLNANFGQKGLTWNIHTPMGNSDLLEFAPVSWNLKLTDDDAGKQLIELTPDLAEGLLVKKWRDQLRNKKAGEAMIKVLMSEIIDAKRQLDALNEVISRERKNNSSVEGYIVPMRRIEMAQYGAIHQGSSLDELPFLTNEPSLQSRLNTESLKFTYDWHLAWVPISAVKKSESSKREISVGWGCRLAFEKVQRTWFLKTLSLHLSPSQEVFK
jgi:hypothetical protein